MNNILKVLLICCFLSFQISISQGNYNFKSMVVSEADLKLNTYSKDTTANAFFIYEKGFSRVENGGNFNLLTDYEAKIKILTPEGYEHSTVEILLYRNKNNKETIDDIIAHTYNMEGGKIVRTALDKNNIYTEKYNDHYTLVKFTLPDIKPGCVIRYSYQKESPFIFNFKGWDFQDDIPKMYSEYVSDLPGNYIYNIRLVGNLEFKSKESTLIKNCLEVSRGGAADCSHNVYTMTDIPAFKEEKYMTAKKNYFSRVDYELKEYRGFDGTYKKYTETWKNADKTLKSEATIGLQLKKTSIVKNILPSNIQSKPNTLEKAKEIYKYIQENYTWNGKYHFFRNVEVKDVIKNRTGNVLEINILLHNIFKQQGFTVYPLILSTRKNGYATKIHPVITDFNYLINQITLDGTSFLLDATEKTLNFGQLPFRCLNQYGRLLDFENGSKWIDIVPSDNSSYSYLENLVLTTDLQLEGMAKYSYHGIHGYFMRKSYNKESEERFKNSIINTQEEVELLNVATSNQENPEKPFKAEISFIKNPESVDNIIFIKPFTNIFFEENPFKLEERTYPVDFGYKGSYTQLVSIRIPEGYEFIDIPKNLKYVLPSNGGIASVLFRKNKSVLNINHKISFLSEYYPPDYYSYLKEFLNNIIDIENNMVITVKRTN